MCTAKSLSLFYILYLKAKRNVSALKEHVKAEAKLAKARAGSATGHYKGKPGKNLDGGKNVKESDRNVIKAILLILQL